MNERLEIVEFGKRVRALRNEAGLTVRSLADKAGVSFALLTCIENAKRGAGRSTVERLGAALGLEGQALTDFILDGLVITKRARILKDAEGYPARVLNALPMILHAWDIMPEQLMECKVTQVFDEGQHKKESHLVLHLKGRSKVHVTFKFFKE